MLLYDLFFKNVNSGIVFKQIQESMVKIDEKNINDFEIHKLICDSSDGWIEILKGNGILQKEFLEWVNRIKEYKIKYVMTQKSAQKFKEDFMVSYNLLEIFSDEMSVALDKGVDECIDTLNEMLPNVNEVHQRLKNLEMTMDDKHVLKIIDYLKRFCELCKRFL